MGTTKNQFIVFMAFLMSLVALTIDAMLPALGAMKNSLGVVEDNDIQLVISMIFLGMSFGMMLYGPLSDAWGRKKALYLGISIYILGNIISLLAQDLEIMLLGRFFQGFGAASCRVVSVAMVRDRFSGVEMGKVMSLIMVFFIIVPALAPVLGQLVMYLFNWQAIFWLFILLAISGVFVLRFIQEETHPLHKRIPFTPKVIWNGIRETLLNPISRGYTLALGLIFGSFISYLSLAQQILQVQFNLGDKFSLYFGGLALFIGMSSFINSRFVEKYGMKKLSFIALIGLSIQNIVSLY